jgi:hypothetical protein
MQHFRKNVSIEHLWVENSCWEGGIFEKEQLFGSNKIWEKTRKGTTVGKLKLF